ncbi:MAG TPA: DUF167 domain-containing protein [Chitinophagales bacterium]|nr:DUF167 domain-containing protein [Chitinophagales bacterium]
MPALFNMLLHVKVKPNAKADEIAQGADGGFIVKIKAPPVEGKANKYLVFFLSTVLGIPKSKIVIQKGENTPYKTLAIDMDAETVYARLQSRQ